MSGGNTASVQINVRYAETDQMGVVYYGNYFTWFEIGRSAFFRSLGHSYEKLEEQGLLLPVVEAYCRYLSPARYEEQITITTRLERLTAARLVFAYTIHRGEILLASGRTTQCFVGKDSGRPVNLKKHYPGYWELLQSLIPK
ncbi:MAG: acyl-CoA thioesterase [Firmicutes bacterium]|nr:acyl-CoA thioesterase [Bacillota bacterium]